MRPNLTLRPSSGGSRRNQSHFARPLLSLNKNTASATLSQDQSRAPRWRHLIPQRLTSGHWNPYFRLALCAYSAQNRPNINVAGVDKHRSVVLGTDTLWVTLDLLPVWACSVDGRHRGWRWQVGRTRCGYLTSIAVDWTTRASVNLYYSVAKQICSPG